MGSGTCVQTSSDGGCSPQRRRRRTLPGQHWLARNLCDYCCLLQRRRSRTLLAPASLVDEFVGRRCLTQRRRQRLPTTSIYDCLFSFYGFFAPLNELLVLSLVFIDCFFLKLLSPKESVITKITIVFILVSFFQLF
jgi:hypothetical protein